MTELEEEKEPKSSDNLRHRGGNKPENNKTKSQINAEYFQALEQWVNDYRLHRYYYYFFAGLPYTMLYHHSNGFPPPSNDSFNNFTFPSSPINQGFRFPNQQQNQNQQTAHFEEGVEYRIPPLWKRLVAEFLDFILLFLMKLAITFIAVEFFEFVDLDKYDTIQQQNKMDYKIALEITSEILILEVIHRLIVCLYEGIFLQRGIQNQIGGATPGKTFMGIKVVLCNRVQQFENRPNIVKVFPATDLGFVWSFMRAVLKNLILVLLFPFCLPFFFNKINRTTYDILCHSIVVEERVQTQRNN